MTKTETTLSVVSGKYDVENKGFLTKEQQILRNLDKEGAGRLTAEQLAPLMEEYKKLHKENSQNRCLIIILFIAVILLGTGTIVATVMAVKASKDTRISSEGVLTAKDSDQPVITTSQGISVATSELYDSNTDTYVHCLPLTSIADLYLSFSKGMNLMFHLNNTLSTGNDAGAGKYSFPVLKLVGDSASYNDTSVNIGDVTIDVSPGNPCNAHLNKEDVKEGDHTRFRRLFERHLTSGGNTPGCSAVDGGCVFGGGGSLSVETPP